MEKMAKNRLVFYNRQTCNLSAASSVLTALLSILWKTTTYWHIPTKR